MCCDNALVSPPSYLYKNIVMCFYTFTKGLVKPRGKLNLSDYVLIDLATRVLDSTRFPHLLFVARVLSTWDLASGLAVR